MSRATYIREENDIILMHFEYPFYRESFKSIQKVLVSYKFSKGPSGMGVGAVKSPYGLTLKD